MPMRLYSAFFILLAGFLAENLQAAPAVDELPDLTGGVIPVVSFDPRGSQNRGGELNSDGSDFYRFSQRGYVRYVVRVRNRTGDPIEADSLIVVVHKIQDMAQLRDVTTKLDIPDADGHTEDGKPFFRIPAGGKAELEPYGESESVTIEIRNPNLMRLYPPVLRVRGVRRTASQDFQEALQQSIRRQVEAPPENPTPLPQ